MSLVVFQKIAFALCHMLYFYAVIKRIEKIRTEGIRAKMCVVAQML